MSDHGLRVRMEVAVLEVVMYMFPSDRMKGSHVGVFIKYVDVDIM